MDKYVLARTTGKIIKELRKQKSITQEHLASILNVSRSVVSKWEAGERIPTTSQYCDLANYFEVKIDDLIGAGQENMHNLSSNTLTMSTPIDKSKFLDISVFNKNGMLVIGTIYNLLLKDSDMLNLTREIKEK